LSSGKVLEDAATMPKHLQGARTLGMAEELKKAIGTGASRDTTDLLDSVIRKSKGQASSQLNRIGGNRIQSHVSDLEQMAQQGGTAGADAMGKLKQMSQGDWSGVGADLKLHPETIRGLGDEAHALSQGINVPRTSTLRKTEDWAKDYTKNPLSASPLSSVMTGEAAAARPIDKSLFRWTPQQGLAGAGAGAMLGGTVGGLGGIPGALGGAALGGLAGGVVGTLGAGGAALAGGTALGGAGLYAGKKMFGGGSETDMYGLPTDRHRAIPILNNQFAGGVGGAILGALVARELGIGGGIGGLLLPILGGVAGRQYLPQMMNRWKDPYGVGANQIHPMSAYLNKQYAE
jgi:hypothetical protein